MKPLPVQPPSAEGGSREARLLNPDLFDSVAIFCAFFQSYMYDYDGHSTPSGHEMIQRFLKIFGKDEIPDFQEDKVETYFAAAFSISAGSDEREQLRQWGFTIDDAFYAQIVPLLTAILDADPDRIFKDGFEGGGASAIRIQSGK